MWNKLRAQFIGRPLLRLAFRIRLFVHKRSIRLSLLLFYKLKLQMRLLNSEFRSEGFDKHLDKIIHIAALRLQSPEIFDVEAHKFLFKDYPESLISKYGDIKSDYEQNKIEIDTFIQTALKNPRIKGTVIAHSLVKNFIAVLRKDDLAAAYFLALAKKYDQSATSIDGKRLFEIDGETRRELKELRYEISDREALKVDLSLSHVGALVSVVSAFFIITGYLYNNFLLGHFGVEVSKYFSLSDYLASSIEGIRYSASGAAIGLISGFIGMHSASRMSYIEAETEKRRRHYWPYLLLVAFLWATLQAYLGDSEQFYSFAYGSIFLVTLIVVPRVARHYFKQPHIALVAIVFVVSFSAHMFESVGKQIHRFEHKDISDLQQYELFFKSPVPFDPKRSVLIAANSSFLFVRDDKKELFIVPREQIEYVLVKTTETYRRLEKSVKSGKTGEKLGPIYFQQ